MLNESIHPSADELTAFGLGRLPTVADGETIARHLAGCRHCEEFVSSVEGDRLVELVRTAAIEGDPPAPGMPQRIVPGYQILHELGRGGMGVVFLARQPGLGRLVALKRLQSAALAGRAELARFHREAEALARLDHPNVVRVYDCGEQDGAPYLALEYIRGPTLADQLKDGPLAAIAAAELVETLARAVDCAHRAGIVHRDLKPANVLIQSDSDSPTRPGIPKITDFGLARPLETVPHSQSGALMGTPGYMAPEQIAGPAGGVGPAADVYALGAILYECLTGRPPFRGSSIVETLEMARSTVPEPPGKVVASIPNELASICMRCLERNPADRYNSAAALADDLHAFLVGQPIAPYESSVPTGVLSRRASFAIVSLGALAVILAAVYWWRGSQHSAPEANEEKSATSAASPVLPGLSTWLRADHGVDVDAAGGVRRWIDQSPARHDAVQLYSTLRPKLAQSGSNALPVLQFNGVNQSLDFSGEPVTSQQFTIVIVVRYENATGLDGSRVIISNWDGIKSTKSVFLGVMDVRLHGVMPRFTDEIGGITDERLPLTQRALIDNPARHFIFTGRSSAAEAEVYCNEKLLASVGRAFSLRDLSGVWRIGTQGGGHEFWSGDIAEILIYDRALDEDELHSVWGYLRDKYFAASADKPAAGDSSDEH